MDVTVYAVFADVGNDCRVFHGVFSTFELASVQVVKKNNAYGFKVCYIEKTVLDSDYN